MQGLQGSEGGDGWSDSLHRDVIAKGHKVQAAEAGMMAQRGGERGCFFMPGRGSLKDILAEHGVTGRTITETTAYSTHLGALSSQVREAWVSDTAAWSESVKMVLCWQEGDCSVLCCYFGAM